MKLHKGREVFDDARALRVEGSRLQKQAAFLAIDASRKRPRTEIAHEKGGAGKFSDGQKRPF